MKWPWDMVIPQLAEGVVIALGVIVAAWVLGRQVGQALREIRQEPPP